MFPLTSKKKNPVPTQKKPRKPQFFSWPKGLLKAKNSPQKRKKSPKTDFQTHKTRFFPFVRNSRPGGGGRGANGKFFPLAVDTQPPSRQGLTDHDREGKIEGLNPKFFKKIYKITFSIFYSIFQKNTLAKNRFWEFSQKKPRFGLFSPKKPQLF